MIKKELFGEDFAWGVSSSAHQTEGYGVNEGKGPSIWDTFSAQKGKIKRGQTALKATRFYKYYRQDLSFIDWMSCPNFRLSFSWPRLFPKGYGQSNTKGLSFYNRLIDTCLEMGITPWVTLYHWDLPQAIEEKGGWKNRDVLKYFEDYVAFCVEQFSDRVDNWMVLNEPTAFTALGYFMGIHAPGKKGLKNFIPTVHHAAMAQSIGGRCIRSISPGANIGTTFSFSHIEAYKNTSKDVAAQRKVDALLNRLFLEPLLGLGYPLEDLGGLKKIEKYIHAGDEDLLPFDFDFIGVQNYSREVVSHSYLTPIVNAKLVSAKKRKVERTEMGWEVYPKAIYEVLDKLRQYKNIPPLIITESGAAFKDVVNEHGRVEDEKRVHYLQQSIQEVLRAKRNGADVRGFFIWSLTDNFEWAEGYHPRFGLVYIDYLKQKRIPKASAIWYRNFLSAT
jgi:beta-glucosidase